MTRPGESLHHPVTGERIIWRKMAQETGGELLQGDLFVEPGGFVAAAHIHPNQEERFKVLAGTLRLRMGGEERILRPCCPPVTSPARSPLTTSWISWPTSSVKTMSTSSANSRGRNAP